MTCVGDFIRAIENEEQADELLSSLEFPSDMEKWTQLAAVRQAYVEAQSCTSWEELEARHPHAADRQQHLRTRRPDGDRKPRKRQRKQAGPEASEHGGSAKDVFAPLYQKPIAIVSGACSARLVARALLWSGWKVSFASSAGPTPPGHVEVQLSCVSASTKVRSVDFVQTVSGRAPRVAKQESLQARHLVVPLCAFHGEAPVPVHIVSDLPDLGGIEKARCRHIHGTPSPGELHRERQELTAELAFTIGIAASKWASAAGAM